ncbi:DUF4400 domain-containing protein, partial [Citrobacter freundii]
VPAYGPQNDVTLKMPAFEWVHVQLHQQKGMISLSPPTICNSARQKSKGMQDMGQGWFVWVKGRMEAFVNVIYQFYTRLALLSAWAPYMLILFAPAVYDGMMTWRIKRTNFDYASPVLHRYSVRGTMYLMVGLFIAFFIPIALDPVVIPITMMTCCVLIGLTFGNLQKRV